MTQTSPRLPDASFWRGRRVLLTGHTGFKGSWLATWLCELGAHTVGVSLPALPSAPSLWEELRLELIADVRADLCDGEWQHVVRDFEPQIVLHLAAQSLVPQGYANPLATFASNVMGTAQVMDVLPQLPGLEAALIITTDKVYDTRQALPHAEDAYVGGRDPYSASKACAELVVQSWPSCGAPVATARSGNVIGGGDWGDSRLMPDLVRHWAAGTTPELRRPHAVRPWQHVLEPLGGYLLYAEALATGEDLPSALNFGPADSQAVRVLDLVEHAAEEWARSHGQHGVPGWSVLSQPPMEETQVLEIDSAQAGSSLGWSNRLTWKQAVSLSVDWYARAARDADARELIREQLGAYVSTDSFDAVVIP